MELSTSAEEVSPQPFEVFEEIKELKVTFPLDYKVEPEYVQQCLLIMLMDVSVICFEIIGTSDSITIQIACPRPLISFLSQQLQVYFRGCIITESDNSLIKLFGDEKADLIIVDLGLSEEFMRPLRTFDSFDPDPLTGIFGVLDSLEKDDIVIALVLFKPVEAPWAQNIMRAVTDHNGDSFFIDSTDIVKLARDKCKHPLFAVNLRLLTKSTEEKPSLNIMKSLVSCLNVYADTLSNELVPLENTGYDPAAHLNDVIFRRTHRSGMILNISELISFVHFPSDSVFSKKLRSGKQKSVEAPPSTIGHEFILGENIHNGRSTKVSLSHDQRMRHMHVLGATGTGKSTFLLNLIEQDIQHDIGVTVLDPHGDLIDAILERIPEKRYEDIILFDPADEQYNVGFNILQAESEIEKNVLSSDLVEIFRRFSTSWGDQMSVVLGNAISALVENRETYSLLELRRFLIEKDFRSALLKNVFDSHIQYFWEKEFPLLKGSSLSSILTRLDFFLRPQLVRNVVGQKHGVSLRDVVNKNKILLVKLSQGIIGDENAYLLGSLIVSKLHQVIMQRQTLPVQERNSFYLYIDEFQNFITPSMKAILSGSRKYSFGLVLAHHDLHQLWETDIALTNAVITNAGTRICFRVGEFDAQQLEGGFAHFDMHDLQNLSVGEAIVRVDRADNDFNLRTVLPTKIDINVALQNKEMISSHSRTMYASISAESKIAKKEGLISRSATQTNKKDLDKKEPIGFQPALIMPQSPVLDKKNTTYHRYLQTLIKRMAEQRGFKAVLEEPTLDGKGRVDVGIEQNGEKIAFEISIITNDDHEMKNIEKCFRSGFQKVLLCVSDKARINELQKLIAEQFDQENVN